ncbi:MAG: hypothetical protein EBT08_17010 [Betaproteobacteria bacterium]|nr:hypothetical protein [Betaproteobacteria bacterium]
MTSERNLSISLARSRIAASQTPGAVVSLEYYREPLADWDAARIRRELIGTVDPEMHYDTWIKYGQAIHHQFQGSQEGFEIWDEMFENSSKYGGQAIGLQKWRSFSTTRLSGRGPVTLAYILAQTRDERRQITQQRAQEMAPVRCEAHMERVVRAQHSAQLGEVPVHEIGDIDIVRVLGMVSRHLVMGAQGLGSLAS